MSDHQIRLAQMERWYAALMASGPDQVTKQFLDDYEPHAARLAELRGRVLDVGGGASIAARFLTNAADHVVVDPSALWRSPRWVAFSKRFRGAAPASSFLEARGEALPFDDRSFDAALAMWSLNHAENPQQCLNEIARVLRPGGKAYLVLEDVPPPWSVLFRDARRRIAARLRPRPFVAAVQMPLWTAVRSKLAGRWPLQDDHLRITKSELWEWTKGKLRLRSHRWRGGYATFEMDRI